MSQIGKRHINDVGNNEKTNFNIEHSASAFGTRAVAPFTKGHPPIVFRSSLGQQNNGLPKRPWVKTTAFLF